MLVGGTHAEGGAGGMAGQVPGHYPVWQGNLQARRETWQKIFESELDVSTLDLSPEQRTIWDRNPHLRQVFIARRPLIVSPNALTPADGMVTPTTRTTKYRRRSGEVKTVEHWGQRKLLFSEIAFLLRYADADLHRVQQVLYAGAAPGNHTNFLSDLFPQMRFHLVDPAPFSAKPTDKITLENAFFTQETATAWTGRTDLFISDIRAITWSMSDAEKEAQAFLPLSIEFIDRFEPLC